MSTFFTFILRIIQLLLLLTALAYGLSFFYLSFNTFDKWDLLTKTFDLFKTIKFDTNVKLFLSLIINFFKWLSYYTIICGFFSFLIKIYDDLFSEGIIKFFDSFKK